VRPSDMNVAIDVLNMSSAVTNVEKALARPIPGYVVFCTVSTVLAAYDDGRVHSALSDATLVTPDGMPLVWLMKRLHKEVDRVYGPDLMLAFLQQTGSRYKHYFFGGNDETLTLLQKRLAERFPDLRIAGAHSPGILPIDDPVRDEDIERINEAGADMVWVGLGHPKQELWMQAAAPRLEHNVLLGVGAAFDFHAGLKKEAPHWMQRSGLQWLHRLGSEPRRLWKRYLVGNSRFIWILATRRVKVTARRVT
jgi:N-acetylglucosaminyldiphosphoundecaprenol N-acetyl-beta-D-mannosaminyltransferase